MNTHFRHCEEKMLPKYDTVSLRDSVKVTDIIDGFGKLRYKVSLTSFDIYNDLYGVIYQVQVVNCFSAPDPLIIVRIPEEGQLPLTDYNEAVKLFNLYVDEYRSLVKAETRDLQDIDVYKDKIGYEITCPQCCLTCKYCLRRQSRSDFVFYVTGSLECINPKNAVEYKYDPRHNYERDEHYVEHVDRALLVHPKVDPFGVCKNYIKADRPFVPAPHDRIIDIVNRQSENIAQSVVGNMGPYVTLEG